MSRSVPDRATRLAYEHMFAYGLSPAVLVSVLLPRFDLAVTLAARGVKTAGAPAALAPADGSAGMQIGTPNAVAAAAGVRAGMRTSEALALCPSLAPASLSWPGFFSP